MKKLHELRITSLSEKDAPELSCLLTKDDEDYRQFFIPFPTDQASLAERLRQARMDRYWGLRFGGNLVGCCMLRGFDEGFQRPSFGVYVAQAFSNRGLSSLALDFCQSWCRLNGVAAMMLKVHPDNVYARKSYEKAGFRFVETCPRTTHAVMEKRWRTS